MRLILRLTVFLILLSNTAQALTPSTPEQIQAMKIQEAILHRRYQEAENLVSNLNLPANSPLPTLVKMTILQSKMFENFVFHSENAFANVSSVNNMICEQHLAKSDIDEWTRLLCAAGDSLRSLFYLKNHQNMKAMNFANRAMASLKIVKNQDPGFIDVELGFALFEFFKSEFTETKLAFLPFFKDKREDALGKIKAVAESGTYAKYLARFSLAFISLDTVRKDLGQQTFPILLKDFPESILFRVMYSAFLIKIGDYDKAHAELHTIAKMAPEVTVVKYFLGRALVLENKNLEEAQKNLSEYLKTKPDASVLGPSYYLLGVIQERKENFEEALHLYKMGYDTYPRYKESLKNLLRLKNKMKQ